MLVGKTLRSKINGARFYVEELVKENGFEYYIILDLESRGRIASGKEWFERGIMQNLEVETSEKV